MAFENQDQPPVSLEDLLRENIKTNKEILESVNFLKNYFRWQVIANGVKIFLITAAIILGLISINALFGRIPSIMSNLEATTGFNANMVKDFSGESGSADSSEFKNFLMDNMKKLAN